MTHPGMTWARRPGHMLILAGAALAATVYALAGRPRVKKRERRHV
ncbi:hypothetical protein [Amycolatopsis thailandensis]|nr:hypothetical protein [Amycolatopsis thailandensis]